MKKIVVALLTVMALPGVPVAAQERCLKASETKTPCLGVVLPTEWALEGEKCRSYDLPSCLIQVQKVTGESTAKMASLEAELALERTISKNLGRRLLECVSPTAEKLPETPWYQNGWVLFGAGLVVGAGVAIGGVAAAK